VKGEEGEEKGSTASLDFGLVSPWCCDTL